jgi:4-amino-4-deoxy-L-arabinose transferase-like glycosyltransferase
MVRGAIALLLPPGFDEAYYYLYTQHLDWSYFDHPAMVALTTGLGVWLTGQVSPFTIRLGSLLLYTGSLGLLYFTSRHLFSAKAAELTLAIASLIPIFFVGFGVLTLPDSPLIFFWSATLYLAAIEFFPPPSLLHPVEPQLIASQPDSLIPSSPFHPYTPSPRLSVIGLLVGLACLSKYHGVALGIGLVGFCLTSSPHRTALRSPWMLGAIALFSLAIAPIVAWNLQHDWISLRFQSGRAIPTQGFNILEMVGVFGVGIAYLLPTFGLPLWWVSGRAMLAEWQTARARQTADYPAPLVPSSRHPVILHPSPLILWLSLPLMLGFTLMGGYRPILPTWAMPGFWGATLLLGAFAERWQARSPRGVKRWLWGSGWAIATILCVALSHLTLGTLQKPSQYAFFGGLLPIQTDASVQLLDMHQLRQGFANTPALQQALQQTQFVFVNEIFLAGQVGMAIAPLNPPPLTCLSDDIRGFAFWSTAQQWVGKSALYITSSRQPNADKYQDYFQQITKIGEIPIRRGGAIVEMIQVYRCETMIKEYPRDGDAG